MNLKHRKALIGGNWKMNLLPSDVQGYAEALTKYNINNPNIDIVLAVPFVMLPTALNAFCESPIQIAAQSVSQHKSGAYTGEVSASQIFDLGVRRVIIGHSERRTYFGETDSIVSQKVRVALDCGLSPTICVGESEAVRNAGTASKFVSAQIESALAGVTPEEMGRISIAYEPIWAIGTGNVASPAQAEEMCACIRSTVSNIFCASVSEKVQIIYGGSMDGVSAGELLALPNIDGGLIGKASLSPDSFYPIIEAAQNNI